MIRIGMSIVALCLANLGAAAAGSPGDKVDAPVMETLEKFAKAYNEADAKALASLWSEKAEYRSDDTDELLEGRKAIEADFAELFAGKKKARLQIDVNRIRRVRPEVASVEGTTRVIRGEGVRRTRFVALLVKQDAGWLIDSVREGTVDDSPTNQENLKELEWLNGTWKHRDKETEIVLVCGWVANGNFRSHKFTLTVDGEVVHEGTQIIGWDPVKKHIRSWVFSSDGSFGEGVWKQNGKRWEVKVVGTLPEGDATTATQIINRLDNDHFSWQVVDRSVGARLLPNIEMIPYGRVEIKGETKGEPKKGE